MTYSDFKQWQVDTARIVVGPLPPCYIYRKSFNELVDDAARKKAHMVRYGKNLHLGLPPNKVEIDGVTVYSQDLLYG